jgi:P27 family predicted phage terminase small subunit
VNPNEPQPEISLPSPPSFLTTGALVEWNRIAPELFELGLLTQLDRAALAAYCSAFACWQDCERQLAESGLLVKTVGGDIVENPLRKIADKQLVLVHKFASEFGFTPASRKNIVGRKKTAAKNDRWAKFRGAKVAGGGK